MKKEKIQIENIPAILYGEVSDKLYIFIHGKHSRKEEADTFAIIAAQADYQIVSFDLPEHGERKDEKQYPCTAINSVNDLRIIHSFFRNKYKYISLYACSMGAYFALVAYQGISFDLCLFVSPILDMEHLIQNMMKWTGVTEEVLKEKLYIETSFGEIFSWDYYQYVRSNPINKWDSRTYILYGENDNLTARSVLNTFAEKHNAIIDIMVNGEHYFHTPEQINYLQNWIKEIIEK